MPAAIPLNALEIALDIRWDGDATSCEILYPGSSCYAKIGIARLSMRFPYFERLLRLSYMGGGDRAFDTFKQWLPVASRTEQYIHIIEIETFSAWTGLTIERVKRKLPLCTEIAFHSGRGRTQSVLGVLEDNFPGCATMVLKCASMFKDDCELATIVKALLVEPLVILPWVSDSGKDVLTALRFTRGLGLDAAQTALYLHTLLEPDNKEPFLLPTLTMDI